LPAPQGVVVLWVLCAPAAGDAAGVCEPTAGADDAAKGAAEPCAPACAPPPMWTAVPLDGCWPGFVGAAGVATAGPGGCGTFGGGVAAAAVAAACVKGANGCER